MSGTDSPQVLAARLQGSRDAFARLLADGDAAGMPWAPSRDSVMVLPSGALEWSSTPLPDSLAVAR